MQRAHVRASQEKSIANKCEGPVTLQSKETTWRLPSYTINSPKTMKPYFNLLPIPYYTFNITFSVQTFDHNNLLEQI